MIDLVIVGAHGRMGERIIALAHADSRFQIAAALDQQHPDPDAIARPQHTVMIDFSSPDGALRAAHCARRNTVPILVGTTGLSAENVRVLDDAARSIPVMIAPNMSLGVAVVNHLAAQCAQLLSAEFDCTIVDTHHAKKRDAPSGTAMKLNHTIRNHRPTDAPEPIVKSIRAGDVVGDHKILFANAQESVEIAHSAASRDLFALGALHAAAWIAPRSPGMYTIEHALNLA